MGFEIALEPNTGIVDQTINRAVITADFGTNICYCFWIGDI